MGLDNYKISNWKSPVTSLADRPKMTAANLKAAFDSNSNELKEAHNKLIEYLKDPAAMAEMTLTINGRKLNVQEFAKNVVENLTQLGYNVSTVQNETIEHAKKLNEILGDSFLNDNTGKIVITHPDDKTDYAQTLKQFIQQLFDGGHENYKEIERNKEILFAVDDRVKEIEKNGVNCANGFVTPEQYGAKGDGKADDTEALVAAIEAASTSKTPLELKHGATYRFTEYIELESNLRIVGNDAVLLSDIQYDAPGQDRPSMGVTGSSNTGYKRDIRIEHVVFRPADTCQCNTMFRVMRAENIYIGNCLFDCDLNDHDRGCWDIYGAWRNVTFESCVFRQLTAGFAGGMWVRSWTNAVESSNCRILNCDFYKAGGDEALAVWGWNGVVKDVLISGCNFYEVDDAKYVSRGYHPAWFITMGQRGLETDVRMEHCVVRVQHCEAVFRMLGAGTHAVVDNCDIYNIQPDDMGEHDPTKGAHSMLAQGEAKITGANGSIIQNCTVTLKGDDGRRVCYDLGTLRNNCFILDIGTGPSQTNLVVDNVFTGTLQKGLFWDCQTVRNNTADISLMNLSWMSGAGIVESNKITIRALNRPDGSAIFHNNWGSGSITGNRIDATFPELTALRKYNFGTKNTVAQMVQNNIVTTENARFNPNDDIIAGIVYRRNNFYNNIPERLMECTGVSFAQGAITEIYKKENILAVTITPEGCTDPVIYTWTNDSGAIEDCGYGVYKPLKDGVATVKINCGAYEATQKITVALVDVPCEAIKLTRTTAICGEGMTTALKAFVTPEWTTDAITWESNAPTIADVSADGVVSGVAQGAANITATCGTQTATCAVTVVDPSEIPAYQSGEWVLDGTIAYIPLPNLMKTHSMFLSFDVDSACVDTAEAIGLISTLLSGQTGATPIHLSFGKDSNGYATVRWDTTDVDIDSEGKTTNYSVTSVNNGIQDIASTAFIYSRTGVSNGSGAVIWGVKKTTVAAAPNSGYLTLNVQTADSDKPVTSFSTGAALKTALTAGTVHATKASGLKIRELIVYANQEFTTYDEFNTYRDGAEIDIRFDANGKAVNAGTAGEIVWSEYPDSQNSGAVVPVTSVALDRNTLELVEGGSAALTATVKPDNATDKAVTWTVSPEGFASVADGKVTAVKAGSCTVTATCGGKSASCAVTVTAAEIVEPNTNPFPSLTPAYMLPQKRAFKAANQEFVDTGVKLFETIDPAPNFTILFEVQGGDALTAANSRFVAFHCMEEVAPWPGLVVQATSGGNMKLNCYGNDPDFGTIDEWKSEKRKFAIRVQDGNLTGWRTDGYAAWGAIKNLTVSVDKTLILGAMQDSSGAKSRYFDGTFYQFVVYDSALTNDQINSWVGEQTVSVQSVTLNKSALTLPEEDSETLTATVKPDNATDKAVTWSASPAGFASVVDGKVTATAAGSCTVTASVGGKSASCEVIVLGGNLLHFPKNVSPSAYGLTWKVDDGLITITGTVPEDMSYPRVALYNLGAKPTLSAGRYKIVVIGTINNSQCRPRIMGKYVDGGDSNIYITSDKATTIDRDFATEVLVLTGALSGATVNESFRMMLVEDSESSEDSTVSNE